MTDKEIKPILDQNACDFSATGNDDIDALIQQRLNTLGPTSVLFYREPLEMVRGEGAWLYDSAGNTYLDAYNNVAVLGHSHPAVANAVSEQLTKLNTHSRYLDRNSHDYASKLLATLPLKNARLVLTCTGSEANDLAIRLAQLATGEQGIIVSEAAYHGNTYLVNQVSPASCKKLPDWVATFSLDALRDETLSLADASEFIQKQIQQALQKLKDKGYDCAALLADSIFSSDGVFALPSGFLNAAVDEVRAAGGIFIADEVQPGFGRTGDALWGFMRHSNSDTQLIPDIVTFGKPMGNGYPVAGLVATQHLLQQFADDDGYFNTFAGSHVAIAAAQTVFDTIHSEQLQLNAQQTGVFLKSALIMLKNDFPQIAKVRGAGLFIGIDIINLKGEPDAELTSTIINDMRQHGVLIGAAGKDGSTLKIRPPLCFKQQHAEQFIAVLSQVLQQWKPHLDN
jgi:4-aminobutyrate aminotransferase-like enzyme